MSLFAPNNIETKQKDSKTHVANKGKRKGMNTVPFLPVRNTHLTKSYLYIQDWLAAVV